MYNYDFIIKLDYIDIPDFEKMDKSKILSIIGRYFPMQKPQERKGLLVDVKDNAVTSKTEIQNIVHYMDKDYEYDLVFVNNYLFLGYKKEKQSKELDLEKIIDKSILFFTDILNQILADITINIKRIGFRIIKEQFDISNYSRINSTLVTKTTFPFEKNTSRFFNNISYNFDNYVITFQYGDYNVNFPLKITDKHFVLDFDCSSQLVKNKDEISDFFIFAKNKQKELFKFAKSRK